MAEAVLHPDPISAFPPGTTVKIYKRPVGSPSSWTPSGAALSEPTVSSAGVLKVEALEENAPYVATAVVGGTTKTLQFVVVPASSSEGAVASVNGKAGVVVLTAADVEALGAASPALTGTPTAPTAAEADNSTKIATTKYADRAVATEATARATGDGEAVKLTGSQTVAGVKTFSSSPVVPAPTTALQAATKQYVDSAIEGLSPKPPVRLATAAALPANAYVTSVITGTAVGALTVDGVAVVANDRVLVKNEAVESHNGIYVVTAAGAVAEAFVLTRAADMNEAAEIPGAFVLVEEGTVNAKNGFFVASKGPFTIGTTAIVWSQFTGAGDLVAGAGITLTGNTIATTAAIHMSVHASVTTNGTTGTVNQLHPVNDEAESRTIKLPTGQVEGSRIGFEKSSAAGNEVAIEGSMRGEAAQTIKLRLSKQTVIFVADAAGSWWPIALFCPLATLSTDYVLRTIAVPAGVAPGNELLAEWKIKLHGSEKRTLVEARIRTVSGTIKVAIKRGEAGATEIAAYKELKGAGTEEVVTSEQALSDKDRITVTSSGGSSPLGLFIDIWEKVEK